MLLSILLAFLLPLFLKQPRIVGLQPEPLLLLLLAEIGHASGSASTGSGLGVVSLFLSKLCTLSL